MKLLLLPVLSLVFVTSAAPAQVIYQPVEFQHGRTHANVGSQIYYYGGSDPIQHRFAALPPLLNGRGTSDRYLSIPYRGELRSFADSRSPVYSDAYPYVNLRPFGFTPSDAQNAAYRAAPGYFRKTDLTNAARRQTDGTLLVPANWAVSVPVSSTFVAPGPRPLPAGMLREELRGTILIIPTRPGSGGNKGLSQASAR